jgi:predicted ATPase
LLSLVNEWVSRRLGLLGKLRATSLNASRRLWSLLGDEKEGSTGINIAAMGRGLSQVLPIVAQTLLVRPGGCLLIEQPETQLHPRAQADLADLFVENVARGRQFIIETHSEHILLRIRRRVAEHTLSPDKVSILFVEKRDGVSHARRLTLNAHGHFADWPDGFFDEAHQEAMALARAQATETKWQRPTSQ